MPRYKVRTGYVFFGKKVGEHYKPGHVLTLTKEEAEHQKQKIEEVPRDKKDNAEPVAKSIDKPSVDKMVKQPEVKKQPIPTAPKKPDPPKAVPAKPAQANAPKPKPKGKPRASTKGRVVARKD